jgi:hypothetical protein
VPRGRLVCRLRQIVHQANEGDSTEIHWVDPIKATLDTPDDAAWRECAFVPDLHVVRNREKKLRTMELTGTAITSKSSGLALVETVSFLKAYLVSALLRFASLPTRRLYLYTRKHLFSQHLLYQSIDCACVRDINERPPRVYSIIDPIFTPV